MDAASQDSLSFECPACSASLTVPGYLAGITGPCPRCGGQITAPNPVAQAATVQQGTPAPNGTASPPPSQPPAPDPAPPQVPAQIPGFPDAPPPVAPAPPNAAAAALGVSPHADAAVAAPAANSGLPWTPLDQSENRAVAAAPAPAPVPAPENTAAAAVAAPMPQAPAEPEDVFAGVPISSPSAARASNDAPVKGKRAINKRAIVLLLLTIAVLGSAFAGYKYLIAQKYGGSGAPPTPPPAIPAPRPDSPVKPASNPAHAGTPSNPLNSNTPPLPAAGTETTPPRPTAIPPRPNPGESAVSNGGDNEPQETGAPVEVGADAARKTLDAFLAATSVEQRAEHVQARDSIIAEMQTYYKKHPLEVDFTSVEFKLSGQVPGSPRQFHVFQVGTDNQKEGFPVSVEETSKGPKVDWVAFTQFHDNALGKFVRIYQHQPATFHAIVERAHYFRTDVPDVGSKVCLRVRPPIPGYEGYAFIDSDSPLAQTAAEKFEWDHMYFPVVELKWVRSPEGHQYIELTRIVQDNWRATK